MTDFLTLCERSERMSRIRGADTKPELMVRRFLHGKGFRYRLHDSRLPGRPDIVLPKYKVVVFVHGCFWHAHRCQKGRLPENRRDYWREKFRANQNRDRRSALALRRMGWHVLTVWECALTTLSKREKALTRLEERIRMLISHKPLVGDARGAPSSEPGIGRLQERVSGA